jgi:hypothetical protein
MLADTSARCPRPINLFLVAFVFLFYRSPDTFACAIADLDQSNVPVILFSRRIASLSSLATFRCEIALLRLSPAAAARRVMRVVDRA